MARCSSRPKRKRASTGTSPRLHTSTGLDESDFECSICLSILLFPVTLPCQHEFCLTCLKENIENGNMMCPLCRKRVSSWLRRFKRADKLINEAKWKEIRRRFPQHVRNRLAGNDETTSPNKCSSLLVLSTPGEIRNEYESALKRAQEEVAKQRQMEEEASQKAIQEILEEEKELRRQLEERQRIAALDEKLARALAPTLSEGGDCNASLIEQIYENIKAEETGTASISTRTEPSPVDRPVKSTPTRSSKRLHLKRAKKCCTSCKKQSV